MRLEIPARLKQIFEETCELSQAYLVGGCVRDCLLGQPVKDFDIEVYGLTYEKLASVLSHWGKTDLVGRSFGVVKLTLAPGVTYDFTVPRRDSKVGQGHKGFEITFDPEISPREAAARRDYTINAMMYDPREEKLIDFFGGQRDIQSRILRHVSDAFAEDPLRVLRGMQFAARFNLKAAAETLQLSRSISGSYAELAPERVREEWFKWALKSETPSLGLHFLVESGWITHFPELDRLRNTPQDPQWHPEGDVFIHTCHCCDALVKEVAWQQADEETKLVLSLATLTHDFGKPDTTEQVVRDGRLRIISPGHEDVGTGLAEAFLTRINTPHAIIKRVLPLVRHHMTHTNEVTDRSVRRLAKRLEPETIENLATLMTADSLGRPPRPPQVPPVVQELRDKARELKIQERAPTPILLGRHLVELGMHTGPEMGRMLKMAYEAQLDGEIANLQQAYAWILRLTGFHLTEETLAAVRARANDH